jgi:hypothetical protein
LDFSNILIQNSISNFIQHTSAITTLKYNINRLHVISFDVNSIMYIWNYLDNSIFATYLFNKPIRGQIFDNIENFLICYGD